MRGLLTFALLAYPPDHRARQTDEVVDTALLAADGSARRAVREAVSLVRAGIGQRLRVESGGSLRDGVALLAGVIALLNLAVALAGVAVGIHRPSPPAWPWFAVYNPYVIDWWWPVFAVAAFAIVLGLVLGDRRLAVGAALANLGIVGYDAIFLGSGGRGHLEAITWLRRPGDYPVGREWLAPAVVLVLATAAAPPRRVSLGRLPSTLVAALLLVVLSREVPGGFFFLRWPLAAVVLLAVAFGTVVPRLAVLALGATVAAAPSVVGYLTAPDLQHDPLVTGMVAAGLVVGALLPLAHLTRRRLT